MSAKHTPEPWSVSEYEEHGGYDCMTGCVRAGPVTLDGADYGQKWCTEIKPAQLEAMLADARLIAAAPDMLAALRGVLLVADRATVEFDAARAAIAKATGEQVAGDAPLPDGAVIEDHRGRHYNAQGERL